MKISLAQDVVWRDLTDEVVILDLASGTYFGLQGAGNDMWRLIVEHGSRERILEVLGERYEVEADRLRADFDALIEELRLKGLVLVDRDGEKP